MTIKKKEMDQQENCPQSAHKLFLQVNAWLVVIETIFHVLWTNLLTRWQKWTKACDKCVALWSVTFITHVNKGKFVLWETQHTNAGQDCSKTLHANQTNKTKYDRERVTWRQKTTKHERKESNTHTNLALTNFDHVPSIVTRSGPNAMLYVFEDNEAVIKMIRRSLVPK